MKHFTNKITNEVWGYESLEEAKELNPDFENLVEMDEKTFIHFRDEKPKGGVWTWDKDWIVDGDKLALELELEKQAEVDALQKERAKLMQEMQYHMLLSEEDKAREIALKIKELE